MNEKNRRLLIFGAGVLVIVLALLIGWFLRGRNRVGEMTDNLGEQPGAPLPKLLATPTPVEPGAAGEADSSETFPMPHLKGTLPISDVSLPPMTSFESLLEVYPELAALVQNLDLSQADEAQFQMIYDQLLVLYEAEGLEGLHQFMVGSGLLEALNLDSTYFDFILAYEEGGAEAAEAMARERHLITENDEMRIVLILDTDDTAEVEEELKAMFDARILQKAGNEIEVGIPLETLRALGSSQEALLQIAQMGELEHIIGMRAPEISLPNIGPLSQEGPEVTGAVAWHKLGIDGDGIRVGVIDPEFGGFLDLANRTLPPADEIVTLQDAAVLNAMSGQHGTACAEIIHAMAPDARLYFAKLDGDFAIGLRRAVDWLLQNDVHIISMSASSVIGPMDGSGTLAEIVNYATGRGVVWVNAAGNSAKSHLTMTFTDDDDDGYHDFNDEGFPLLPIESGASGWIALNWDDSWRGGASENYDLYLYASNADGSDLELVDSSRNVQSGKAIDKPYEDVGFLGRSVEKTYYLAVQAVETTHAAQFTLLGNHVEFALWAPENSITTPGDAEEALTVGATYWLDDLLEDYSSQGPTTDGRRKPDIAAPAGVTVASPEFIPYGFYGTSASAPHVAGAAALVWSANPEAGATEIRDYLLAHALDLGVPGPDTAYGFGRLELPPAEPVEPVDTKPRATLQRVWQDHNVYLAGIKGMKIHAAFDVYNLKGQPGTVLVEFFDAESGQALRDKNGDYALESGEVAVWEDFSPSYDDSRYTDFDLFMPYSELELAPGEYQLRFQITVFDSADWTILSQSDFTDFTYRRSAPVQPSATMTSIDIEHAYVLDGVRGMNIKVSFDIAHYRGREGMAAAYFYFGDEQNRPLRDFNGYYATRNGYVGVGRYFEPGYDQTTYHDFELFIPYTELHMAPDEEYRLKFYIIIWDIETSSQLTYSDWQYFWFKAD